MKKEPFFLFFSNVLRDRHPSTTFPADIIVHPIAAAAAAAAVSLLLLLLWLLLLLLLLLSHNARCETVAEEDSAGAHVEEFDLPRSVKGGDGDLGGRKFHQELGLGDTLNARCTGKGLRRRKIFVNKCFSFLICMNCFKGLARTR